MAFMYVICYMVVGQAVKIMFWFNQKGGIDCLGCVWLDFDDECFKFGEYCENGIKVIVEEVQKKIIGCVFF